MPYTRTGMPRGPIPEQPTLLWGSIPVGELEGHEPDPAYDVRRPDDGLGAPPVRAEMLGFRRMEEEIERGGGRLRTLDRAASRGAQNGAAAFDRVQPSASPGEGPPSPLGLDLGFDLGSMLPLLVLGGVLLFMAKR